MVKRKIIDHQSSGEQKLALVRNKDRSLDSLTSPKDKRLMSSIEKSAGEWWVEAREKRRAKKAAKAKLEAIRKLL